MNKTFVVELKIAGELKVVRIPAPNSGTAASIASLKAGQDNPKAKVDVVRAWLALS